ncbi:DUF1127 domain-containing protein [Aureimonas fodinaquatilis]|uniref:DUF1127 domain-containing protein n=2 Tax=Aureimonas fodinaquatilis TaxID=2565783 RepID=A0A5B0E2V6_9HYPH|nr:DUF1127 domain-containing protein [Aureimonas fodinaquatilis]
MPEFASNIRLGLAAVPAVFRAFKNRRQAHYVADLPDYLLADLGIKRDDVHDALNTDWRQDPTYQLAVRAAKRRRAR